MKFNAPAMGWLCPSTITRRMRSRIVSPMREKNERVR